MDESPFELEIEDVDKRIEEIITDEEVEKGFSCKLVEDDIDVILIRLSITEKYKDKEKVKDTWE